jgi:hypothetical protein
VVWTQDNGALSPIAFLHRLLCRVDRDRLRHARVGDHVPPQSHFGTYAKDHGGVYCVEGIVEPIVSGQQVSARRQTRTDFPAGGHPE